VHNELDPDAPYPAYVVPGPAQAGPCVRRVHNELDPDAPYPAYVVPGPAAAGPCVRRVHNELDPDAPYPTYVGSGFSRTSTVVHSQYAKHMALPVPASER
jgi:hypothetical protein